MWLQINPFALSLSKGRFVMMRIAFRSWFDKLTTNGGLIHGSPIKLGSKLLPNLCEPVMPDSIRHPVG